MPRTCPYCAESIHDAAHACPHCRSPLGGPALETFRDRPGRQLGGVAIALSRSLGISVTFLRLLFIVFTFVSFIGPFVYAALWLLIPFEPGGISPLGRLLESVSGSGPLESQGDPAPLERGIQWSRRQFNKFQAWFRSKKQSTEGTP